MTIGEWIAVVIIAAASAVGAWAALCLIARMLQSTARRCSVHLRIGHWTKNDDEAAAQGLKKLVNGAQQYLYVVGGGNEVFWGRSDVKDALEGMADSVAKLFIVPSSVKSDPAHPLRQLAKADTISMRYCDADLPEQHFRLVDGRDITLEVHDPQDTTRRWYKEMLGAVFAAETKEREFQTLWHSAQT